VASGTDPRMTPTRFARRSRLFVEGGTVLCKAHGRHLWSGLIWLDNPRINGARLDTARLSFSEFG
jgi:hypothetical protein